MTSTEETTLPPAPQAAVNSGECDARAIELRSEGVQEIMGRVPPWAIRYGIVLMTAVVLSIMMLAALIRWPDVVAGTGTLTSADPPRTVVARNSGRLISISATEGANVQEGLPLAVIESTASPSALDSLRALLPSLRAVRQGILDTLPPMPDLVLGDGREAWSALRSSLTELVVWRRDTYRTERQRALQQKVLHFRRMITATEKQVAWARRKAGNNALEASIDTALADKGVIAATEFRRGQNAFLDQQMSFIALEAALQQQHITLIDLQEQMNELLHTDEATERDHNARCSAALNAMERFVNDWQLGHEVRAPITGVVHCPVRLSPQQPIAQGDVLFTVAPPDSTFLVEAILPAQGSGKVKIGQPVHVEAEGFPRTEYGRLTGRVAVLAPMPSANGYRVVIELPRGLNTSFHRILPFKPEMPVRVEVVTQDRSALGRVFATIRGIADR